jgi:hypothetical protein
LEVTIPLAYSVKQIFVLRIKHEHSCGGLVHVKLMHEAIVHLPGKIPEPYLAIYAIGISGLW